MDRLLKHFVRIVASQHTNCVDLSESTSITLTIMKKLQRKPNTQAYS